MNAMAGMIKSGDIVKVCICQETVCVCVCVIKDISCKQSCWCGHSTNHKMIQLFPSCITDGTIRNGLGFCLDVKGTDGLGNVRAIECQVFPTVSKDQQWKRIQQFATEDSGIPQTAFKVQNVKSGQCLDAKGTRGFGADVGTKPCESEDLDHFWYFRNRGAVVGHGKLVNAESNKCFDIQGTDGLGSIVTNTCADKLDQTFTLYENGELVNAKSKRCVDIAGSDGRGNIQTGKCLGHERPDQKWKKVLEDGEFFSIATEASSNFCVDPNGFDGKGDIRAGICNDQPEQKWRWVSSNFLSPVGKWDLINCNESGGIEFTITSSKTSTESISTETTIEVSNSLEAGAIFGGVTTEVSVSTSLANSFETSSTDEFSVAVTCDVNEDGETEFTSGCMWQWSMDILAATAARADIVWKAPITRCTSDGLEPKCPPFQRCIDEACTGCIDLADI